MGKRGDVEKHSFYQVFWALKLPFIRLYIGKPISMLCVSLRNQTELAIKSKYHTRRQSLTVPCRKSIPWLAQWRRHSWRDVIKLSTAHPHRQTFDKTNILIRLLKFVTPLSLQRNFSPQCSPNTLDGESNPNFVLHKCSYIRILKHGQASPHIV